MKTDNKYSDTKLKSQAILTDKSQFMLYFPAMDKKVTEISTFIKSARKSLNMTQEVFGDKVGGYTKGNVSAWENGKYEPPYQVLKGISEMSGIALPNSDEEKALKILKALGIDVNNFPLEEELYLKAAIRVPAKKKGDVQKMVRALGEDDGKKEEAK